MCIRLISFVSLAFLSLNACVASRESSTAKSASKTTTLETTEQKSVKIAGKTVHIPDSVKRIEIRTTNGELITSE